MNVAVVTGGTSGIGLACARQLLSQGHTVVISGRSAERGRKALAELEAGDRANYLACDVTSPVEISRMITEVVDIHQRLDVLVNCAGGAHGAGRAVTELGDDELTDAFHLNVNSAFWTSRAALKHMIPQGYGRIINMASLAGKNASPRMAEYATAKHALLGLTKTLAKEVSRAGITVNAVCPGITDTELVRQQFKGALEASGMSFEKALSAYTRDLGRMVRPDEVAALVGLLASPNSSAVSGTAISVDGSYTQW